MAMTIQDVPGSNCLIETFDPEGQSLHAPYRASGEILRCCTRRTATAAGASQPSEKGYGAVDSEKLRGEMGQTQNGCAHECDDFRRTAVFETITDKYRAVQ